MKRSILIETIPTTRPISYDQDPKPGARDVLEVTVEYTTGGTSYFTGHRHQRGYRISASPFRIDDTSKSCVLCGKGGGIYHFLKEANRFHQGTLEKLAAGIRDSPDYHKLIESALAHNHCQRTDQAAAAELPSERSDITPPITQHKKAHSPWGKVDGHSPFGDLGLYHHSTPGHGGIYVPDEMLSRMPKPYRDANHYGGGNWFEEDCEWALVALSFPSGLSEKQIESATRTVKNWYPHAWMAVTGETLIPEDSSKLRDERDREIAKDKYVAVCAWGHGNNTTHNRIDVPPGMIGVCAAIGGRDKNGHCDHSTERYFLVPEEEYQTRSSFGFIMHKEYPAWPAADEAAPDIPTKRINPEAIAQAKALFSAA
jgi:hypothetical protein